MGKINGIFDHQINLSYNGKNHIKLLLNYGENLWVKFMGKIYGKNLWAKLMGKINGKN